MRLCGETQKHALQKLLTPQTKIRKQALNLVERRLAADVDTQKVELERGKASVNYPIF
jgi:DNA-binding TFAR19-related protein (PDSD5 family)